MSVENLKALSRLAALISEGYPFAALQAKIKNSRIDIVAPQGAHAPVLEVINQFRHGCKLAQVQLVVVATGREAEDGIPHRQAGDPRPDGAHGAGAVHHGGGHGIAVGGAGGHRGGGYLVGQFQGHVALGAHGLRAGKASRSRYDSSARDAGRKAGTSIQIGRSAGALGGGARFALK